MSCKAAPVVQRPLPHIAVITLPLAGGSDAVAAGEGKVAYVIV